MLKTKRFWLILSILFGIQAASIADDTEIYIDARLQGDAEPMVFLMLDYRSNLGSTYCNDVLSATCEEALGEAYDELLVRVPTGQAELFDALRAVFDALFAELDGVKVAFVMSHDDSCSGPNASGGPGVTGCSNGAYILQGLQSFEDGDVNGAKASMLSKLTAIPSPQGNVSHAYQGKEMYFEIFRYLTGQNWHNMQLGWDDYGTNGSQNLPDEDPLLSWDDSIITGASYDSPLINSADFTCSQAYGINMMFAVSNQDGDADDEINATIANGGMNLGINSPDFDDVLRWMFQTDLAPSPSNGVWPSIEGEQNFQSYVVASQVNNSTNGYANAGGTVGALPLDEPGQLLEDLRLIFREIISVSTTFVAASVPVNVFNRSDIVDNVFLAQFSVDPDAKPNWSGNLKKLKILETVDEFGSDTIALVDANDEQAIASDGRIAFDALTYWTDSAALPPAGEDEVEGADGRSIERGGSGQNIPGYLASRTPTIGDNNAASTRTVFTENATGDTLINFGTFNALSLQSDLGAANVFDAADLIRWARGRDIDDEDNDGDDTEARGWIMGAPLHSRPLPLNFGARSAGYSESNPDIRIYMGTDDGFMHSIRNTDALGNESGEEDWAFIPRAVMDKIDIIRTNSSATAHPYMVDGAPTAYIVDTDGDGTIGKDANGNADPTDRAIIYFGLRRGGKNYYAIDVTDPDNPDLLWTLDNSGDYSELGMSFSSPRVGTVKFGATPTPVIIFGGGYDPDKDIGHDDSDEGNAIFIANALTGDLVWKVTYGAATGSVSSTEYNHSGMIDAIPSDLSAVDTNADGNIDRVYVGDTGGTVWRLDLLEGNTDVRSNWFASELANLGREDASPVTNANDRRFFHRPDFVPSSDNNGAFDGVLIGSGDRASPRETNTRNFFFMLKDRNVTTGTVVGSPYNAMEYNAGTNAQGLGNITDTCINSTSCTADLTNGWRLQLEEPGEKALAPALTAFGTIFFTTFLPDGSSAEAGSSCEPTEGAGRLYAVKIADGAPVNNYDATDGNDSGLTKSDRFNPLASGGIPAEVVPVGDFILPPDLNPEPTGGRAFWKTFWYEKDVDSF